MTPATNIPTVKNYWIFLWAFAAVYVIWGSTYLAIRFALETIPPLLMAGARFTIAGAILYSLALLSDGPQVKKVTQVEWRNSFIVGFMLLVCGNGGVVWSEQMLPSGITALVVSIEPVWVVLIVWASNLKKPPVWQVWVGLILGISGMAILVNNGSTPGGTFSITGFVILLFSTFMWAAGSLYSSRAQMPASAIRSTAMQMLCGGSVLMVAGIVSGEGARMNLANVSASSLYAFIYLIVFGSIIGYSAYSYLTKAATPSQVSTYAYVNPVIAVALGTWLGNEVLTTQMLIATPILVTAVVLLLWDKKPKQEKTKH